MSSASDREIAELDKSLAADGEEIVLRRVVGTTNQVFNDVTCLAFVRGYAANELIGGITQQDSKVILSPTQINRAQWPGGQPPTVTGDPRIPSKSRGDKAIIAGKVRTIESATAIPIDGVVVRIEMRVSG